jgi:hypothetical protein
MTINLSLKNVEESNCGLSNILAGSSETARNLRHNSRRPQENWIRALLNSQECRRLNQIIC